MDADPPHWLIHSASTSCIQSSLRMYCELAGFLGDGNTGKVKHYI